MSPLALTILCLVFCSYSGIKRTDASGVALCYYSSWALDRPGYGTYGVGDLPIDLCTHISYAFLDLTQEGELIVPEQKTVNGKTNRVADFTSLKDLNANLTLLVAIGGWSAGSANFSAVVNNDTLRATFANNLLTFIEDNDFDGLDLCWDYPALEGGVASDKEQYGVLMKELRELFGTKYLLTSAVGVTQSKIDTSFNVTALNEYLDYISLQTYEYHGTWDNETGVNAPLYPQTTDAADSILNVNTSVHVWIENGASPSKLILGIANFGKTFNLTDADDHDTGAPFSGAGTAGNYTQEAGVLSYYEICTAEASNSNWTIEEETGSYVYAYKESQWIGYDNPDTVYAKGQYAKNLSLAGVMFWTADHDDFRGLCGTKYPLIQSAIDGYAA